MKLDHIVLIETIIFLFSVQFNFAISSHNNNYYSTFVFAAPTCSSSASKSPQWINIVRIDNYVRNNITDIGQNSTILKHVPKLAEAIMMADFIYEQLKPFTNSAITALPVSPTSNIIISDKDIALLLQYIPFNVTSDVDRKENVVRDFKALISHKNNSYLLHIFAIRCAE